MTKNEEHEIMFNRIYVGTLVDVKIFKDRTAQTSNYFIMLEKIGDFIGAVGSKPYILYKDIFSENTFYINENGNAICNNIEKNSDIIKRKIQIVNFYPIKEIFKKASNLLDVVPEPINFNNDYFKNKDFIVSNNLVDQCLDEENFIEVDSKLLNSLQEGLEIIFDLVTDKNKLDHFSNYFSNILNSKENIPKDMKHIELIKNDDNKKLT